MDTICGACGLAAPPGPDGLCPRCLLRAALTAPAPAFPRMFGKYELLAQLDRGGMGVVFRAYDRAAERVVALKVLKDGDLASDADVARFQDEARKAASLRDKAIVRVLDVGEVDGRPYFTMDLMTGGSLAARIADFQGRPAAAARLVAVVARAVHHAHQRFVLHRDLKPANILLDGEGKPHVADFGIARRLDIEPSSNRLSGTLPYMAPEQIQSPRDLTVAVDVYGLGAVLYELLTGRPPVIGDSAAEIVANIVDRDPPRPRSFRRSQGGGADIDVDLETICMKCLRKAPAERYASAAGLAADLKRYLSDDPIEARPPSTSERIRRALRRHPVAAALGLTALTLLVAIATTAVSVARTQENELRAEALKVNAYAARALSGAVAFELRELADELGRAARDPAVMEVASRPRDAAAIAAWRALPLPRRFDSAMIMDTGGRWIARAPRTEFDFVGQPFCWRDYCAMAAQAGREGRTSVHVGRSYRSVADGTARFSLSTPIYDGQGRWVGVLQGAVDTAAALGALALIDPGERHRLATIVARRDRDLPDEPLPDDWSVMLHEGVARGSLYRMESRGALAAMPSSSPQAPAAASAVVAPAAEDDDYRDPIPGFEGRWLAGTAPVGGTPFAVIVQTRYEAAVATNARLARRLRAAGAGALGVALIAGLALFAGTRARRRV